MGSPAHLSLKLFAPSGRGQWGGMWGLAALLCLFLRLEQVSVAEEVSATVWQRILGDEAFQQSAGEISYRAGR